MATVEAKAAPEKDVKAQPTSTENTSKTASDNTRDQATDSTAARNMLVDQALSTYADAGIAAAKPLKEGATTGDDGFGLVDGPTDAQGGDAKPTDSKQAETKQDATDVAQMVFIPVMEQPPAEFPRTLFGVEIDPDKLLNDKPEGDIDFGLGQSYDGGFLKMNVRPTNYEVRPGETLEQIARKHLGPKATQDDVDTHVAEIERANVKTLAGRDSETYEGKKGEILRLPGHTADGADLYKDHRGTIYRVTEDGKMKVTYLDGSGFERTPNDDGGITKSYFSKKPEDNYSVTLDKNGKIVENTRVDPNHKPAQDLATESKRLEALAEKGLGIKNEREQCVPLFHPATAKKGDPGEVATVGNINDMTYLLNGKDEDNVFISNEVMSPSDNRDPGRTNFSSPQELIERLTAAKAEGKPMSVGLGVFSNGEPFYDSMVKKGVTPFDVESSVAGLVQDAHAVRVIGFDPKTGMVQIDNQWGDENDIISKPISVYELYNATKPVPPTEWMRRLGDRWDNETPEANARNLKSVMGASFFDWSINQEARGIPVDERAKQAVMDPADLRAHGEGANNPYRGQNMRTYASQIFQVTAGNTFYTNQNEGRVPPGDVRYSQVKPQGGLDTGERVIDYNRSPAATNLPLVATSARIRALVEGSRA